MLKNYSKAEVLALEGDPGSYKVPLGEEGYYHCIIEVRNFDSHSGERRSSPRIQKFGVKAWRDEIHNLRKHGYTVTMLHDPTDGLRQNHEKQIAAAKVARTKINNKGV